MKFLICHFENSKEYFNVDCIQNFMVAKNVHGEYVIDISYKGSDNGSSRACVSWELI